MVRARPTTPSRFLVELRPAGLAAVEELSQQARAVAGRLAGGGRGVRFLRAVAVPEDGSYYLLWEAESRARLKDALKLLGYEATQLSEVVAVEHRQPAEEVFQE